MRLLVLETLKVQENYPQKNLYQNVFNIASTQATKETNMWHMKYISQSCLSNKKNNIFFLCQYVLSYYVMWG